MTQCRQFQRYTYQEKWLRVISDLRRDVKCEPLSTGTLRKVGRYGITSLRCAKCHEKCKVPQKRISQGWLLFWAPQHWRYSSCLPYGRQTVVFNKLLIKKVKVKFFIFRRASNLYLCLYNQLFALYHYFFKFLTP